MRKVPFSVLAALVLLFSASAPAQQEQQAQLLDGIAAVVNQNIILKSELAREMRLVYQRLNEQGMEAPPVDVLQKQVLERLVVRELQLQEAARQGLTIDDITLDETVRNIAANNNMSIEQFRRHLESQGDDYRQFRSDLRQDILIDRLRRQAVHSRILISEQEVDDYLAAGEENDTSRYLLSHIQVSLPEASDAEAIARARERAEALYQRILDGESFAQLAVSESDGRHALEGGDLGWRTLNELPAQFATEVRRLKIGDVSKPFRTPRGFHLLKLHDTQGVERHMVRQVNARHILLTPNMLKSDDDIRRELADLRQQILDGAGFAELAREHSEDPGSVNKGGELGWAQPDRYTPAFSQVLERLPVGKVSEPFKSPYGWHIVEVLGWRNYDNTVEHQRAQARETLFKRKAGIEEELWLQRLRDEAYVDYRLD